MRTKLTTALLVIFICIGMGSYAQFSNLIVFTQENEPFTIVVNGVQQNPSPETNIKITGLNAPSYKVRLHFQNPGLADIDKTVYLTPESEASYQVLKNNKGVWVIRIMGSVPIDEATQPVTGQDIYGYSTTPRLSNTTVTQTTTIQTGGMPGMGSVTFSTTQTNANSGMTITTESNGMEDRNRTRENDHEGTRDNHMERHQDNDQDRDMDRDREDYSGPRGCPRPMGTHSFEEALESIRSKTFANTKLTIAKQVVGANCLRCKQVKEIMKLFTFESDKLEFAKFAYKYTWDIKNYFLLNDAFEFESSVDELNRFINGNR